MMQRRTVKNNELNKINALKHVVNVSDKIQTQ